MKENTTVVVLAAGLGTRMKSHRAKVLHEAGGDTLLNNVIRAALKVAPPEQIVAVVGHQADQVRASVRTPGIRFAVQAEQKGTGHAVLCARDVISERTGRLMILNGDGPLLRSETLARLLDASQHTEGGSIVTTYLADPTGYGRIIRNKDGLVAAVIEQKSATHEQLAIREVNPGVYCFNASLFWQYIDRITPDNAAREYYLTDMIGLLTGAGHGISPMPIEDETELLGINTRVELAIADRILRQRKANALMLSGVTLETPESITIDADVEVGQDTVVESNVQLRGRTRIGAQCRIGAGSILRDCTLADGVTLLPYVVAEQSTFEEDSFAGPFSRFRMQAQVSAGAHVGNFVELKKTALGPGSKASHLAYLGDSVIGAGSNIGAGTITCNYDGDKKHQTRVGDGAFVGSNSTLVAPLSIQDGAYIAAGSVITKDVEADALALGRAYQVDKPGWARKRRELKRKSS